MPDNVIPLVAAAQSLGKSPATLRRWVRAGAPVARHGGRGRGRAALFDPLALVAWHRGRSDQSQPNDALRVFAAEVPEMLARSVWLSFCDAIGPHKRACAPLLSAVWYNCATGVLDRMRANCSDIPELTTIPELIERLNKIDHT